MKQRKTEITIGNLGCMRSGRSNTLGCSYLFVVTGFSHINGEDLVEIRILAKKLHKDALAIDHMNFKVGDNRHIPKKYLISCVTDPERKYTFPDQKEWVYSLGCDLGEWSVLPNQALKKPVSAD